MLQHHQAVPYIGRSTRRGTMPNNFSLSSIWSQFPQIVATIRVWSIAKKFADLCHDTNESAKSVAEVWVKLYSHMYKETSNKITSSQSNQYKSSRPSFCTIWVWCISKNKIHAACCIFCENSHTLAMKNYTNRFCLNIHRQHQTRQLSVPSPYALYHGSLPYIEVVIQPLKTPVNDE